MDIHRCRFVDYTPHTITATAFSHPSTLSTKPPSSELRLAIGRSNGDIEIWNPRYNWTHELTLPGSKGRSIEGLVWATSPEGTESPRLFSVGGSTYITEWNLSTGKPITNYDCNAGIIWSIDVSSNNQKLAVGCDDGSVVIVDISGGPGFMEYDLICQRQDARVLSIKWDNKNQPARLVGGCADGRIRVWSADGETKGRILGTMRVDKSKTESTLVWSLSVMENKGQLISGDSTGSVKIWDLENYTLLQSFKVHDADVLCLVHDVNEEKIFSGGVDRKIHQFDLISTKTSSKWVHSFNRLLHSNDIRSMSIYENKGGYGFLVSGGVERAIVVQHVQQFHDGKYKKLLINQQLSNVIVDSGKRLIIMWQDQQVKIWKILENGKYKLVCKVSLADDENITSVDYNSESNLLAVSKLTSVKLFQLEESTKGKLHVHKIRDESFDSLIEGAKLIKFIESKTLLIVTPEEELYKFDINPEQSRIELSAEIEQIEPSPSTNSTSNKLQHASCINNLIISPDCQNLIISRYNGQIEIYPLNGTSPAYILTKLSSYAHLLQCSTNEKLIVLTEDNKIFEFYINQTESKTLQTPWSRRNSEFLPRQFTSLEDKPQGMVVKYEKLWIFGSAWLVYFDLSVNIPISKEFKNAGGSGGRKRNRNGLSIIEDEASGEVDENVEVLETSLKQREIDRLRQQIQDDEQSTNGRSGSGNQKPFFITEKYRPIMKVCDFGENEIVVIERPYFALPTTPAFNLPKLKI
ncbi:UTP4 [[Candida] subhashii]|uniref:UTP4 n=1 Tax=[Candida] subhashii TaxID=561895 RepID=A0A8J5UN94_9ASCO|nr:UTP4 [[Candida] subhashii]KAG7666453.1 UTP4 [[Candida] subhashii]